MFTLHRKDGTLIDPETILIDFRGASWIYESVTHPRKVNVRQGPKEGNWPETITREFYPAVFDVVIRDIDTGYRWPPTHDDTGACQTHGVNGTYCQQYPDTCGTFPYGKD